MADVTTEAPAPKTRAPRTPAANKPATEGDKKTIQVAFDAKDAELYKKIVKDAETDERSASNFLMRFIRNNYPKDVIAESTE